MYIAIMPTIFAIGAFNIVINTADHPPAHVHCVGPGVVVIIAIAGQGLIKNRGVASKDFQRLRDFIKENKDVLMTEWRHFHEKE